LEGQVAEVVLGPEADEASVVFCDGLLAVMLVHARKGGRWRCMGSKRTGVAIAANDLLWKL